MTTRIVRRTKEETQEAVNTISLLIYDALHGVEGKYTGMEILAGLAVINARVIDDMFAMMRKQDEEEE